MSYDGKIDPKRQKTRHETTADETTDPVTSLRHQPTMRVRDQGKNDDCGIWVITNAFMREIVILLGWVTTSEDPYVNWELDNDDNCSKYINDPAKYDYCALYTFLQHFLRKNFGSCGMDGEPAMRDFCKVFNKLMSESIYLVLLQNISIIDIEVDTAQQVKFIHQLKILIELNKTQDTIDSEKREEFNNELMVAETRLSELITPYQYVNRLLEILGDIQTALAGLEFSVIHYVINDFVKGVDGNPEVNPDNNSLNINCSFNRESDTFNTLQTHFNTGHYALGALEFGESFYGKFSSIKVPVTENPHILNEILIKNKELVEQQTREEIDIDNTDSLNGYMNEYLNIPSGLQNSNQTPGEPPITMFDTFCSMIYEPDRIINSGHAVIIKNIFIWLFESDVLGEYYYYMKNTWKNTWGINGNCIFPFKINPYVGIFIFKLIPKASAEISASASAEVSSEVSTENPVRIPLRRLICNDHLASIYKIPSKNQKQIPRKIPRRGGGKRRNLTRKKRRKITRKKNYRNPHRKTNRKKNKRIK